MRDPVPYSDDLEALGEDEEATTRQMNATMETIMAPSMPGATA